MYVLRGIKMLIETPWGAGTILPAEHMISGKKVFQIMDTHGIPLDIILEQLKDRGLVMNTIEFIESALVNKNFTEKTIKRILCGQVNMPESLFDACMRYIGKVRS